MYHGSPLPQSVRNAFGLRHCILFLALVSAAFGQLKTDSGIYVEPSLPALPAAGGKLVDPTFGTTIMRLTDQNDGDSDCKVQYSYWPAFNVDNTYVMAICVINGRESTKVWRFDPNTFTRGAGSVIDIATPSGWGISSTDVIWSGVDPNVFYGHPVNAQTINAQNVTTGTNVMIKDLTSEIPAGASLLQMSKSDDDNVFAFHINDSSGSRYGYIVWRRDINKVILKQTSTGVDEVHVDKTGRYLVVVNSDESDRIWDLSNSTVTDLAFTSTDQGFVHYATGTGNAVTAYWNTIYNSFALGARPLSSPKVVTRLLSFSDTTQDMHYSWLSKDETYATISTFSKTGGAVQGPFQNEVFQVATDGSGRVRRVCHHRSVYNDYVDQPKANISMDGRYIAFTSNWGNANGRRDAFIVRIPDAAVAPPTAGITASPASITAGQSATLSWSTSNATSVSISGVGAVATSGTLSVTPSATTSYTVTATNASGSASQATTVTVTAPAQAPPPATPFSQYMEAESAVLAAPMARFSDTTASGGGYIDTTAMEAGTATLTVTVPSAGTYIVWGRVLAPSGASDSMYVAVDGGTEDVWDAAETSWSSTWKWTRVNGRNGTGVVMALNPRTFNLSAGTHTIVFRGRETGTRLDRVFITNDATATPSDSTSSSSGSTSPTPPPSGSGSFSQYLEAESGTLVSPMVKVYDSSSSGKYFILSETAEAGKVTFTINAPTTGNYVVWTRLIASVSYRDSFYVSLDGGKEDIYDAAQGTWSKSWQWCEVNGRNGTATPLTLNPRVFSLSAGTHTLTFRTRDAKVYFDRLFVTNNLTAKP